MLKAGIDQGTPSGARLVHCTFSHKKVPCPCATAQARPSEGVVLAMSIFRGREDLDVLVHPLGVLA